MGAGSAAGRCTPVDDLSAFEWELPPDFPAPKVPEDNPMSAAKVELGRFLFYDTRLSANRTQSCATCHRQELGFTDGLARAVGSSGGVHPRSAMGLTNVAYQASLNWADPTVRRLENQARAPLFTETPIVELGLAENALLERLRDDERYPCMFARAFPNDDVPITVGNVTKALAAFQRTLISGNSAYDRYTRDSAQSDMSEAALNGALLFFSEKFDCFHCHGGFNFSSSADHEGVAFDQAVFFNNGLYNVDGNGAYPAPNTGLHAFSGEPDDMGRFKPPTLRNIAVTAPYMHDGSVPTLEGVLEHYAAGGRIVEGGELAGDGSENPFKSTFVRGFEMTGEERHQLLAFLRSLTDESFLAEPRFSSPFDEAP
jgi:cytochrome c peroxidase